MEWQPPETGITLIEIATGNEIVEGITNGGHLFLLEEMEENDLDAVDQGTETARIDPGELAVNPKNVLRLEDEAGQRIGLRQYRGRGVEVVLENDLIDEAGPIQPNEDRSDVDLIDDKLTKW